MEEYKLKVCTFTQIFNVIMLLYFISIPSKLCSTPENTMNSKLSL